MLINHQLLIHMYQSEIAVYIIIAKVQCHQMFKYCRVYMYMHVPVHALWFSDIFIVLCGLASQEQCTCRVVRCTSQEPATSTTINIRGLHLFCHYSFPLLQPVCGERSQRILQGHYHTYIVTIFVLPIWPFNHYHFQVFNSVDLFNVD